MNGKVIFTKNEEDEKQKLKERVENLEGTLKELKGKVDGQTDGINFSDKKYEEIHNEVEGKKGPDAEYNPLGENVKPIKERQELVAEMETKAAEKEKKEAEKKGTKPKEGKEKPIMIQGYEEAIKETIKQMDYNMQKFETLVEGSKKALIEVRSGFPFSFLPNKIIVDVNKISTVSFKLLAEPEKHAPVIEDIDSVSVNKAFTVAAMNIILKSQGPDKPVVVKYLEPRGAQKAKVVIDALLTAKKQGIDLVALSSMEVPELLKKLEDLGQPKNK